MSPTAEQVKRRGSPSHQESPALPRKRPPEDGAAAPNTEPEPRDDGTTNVREAGSRIAAAMLEAADPATGEHSDDVELVVDEICHKLSVNGEVRENVLVAARLHDVGKVAIPREILEKPGPLDDDEWARIKEHTLTGERILKAVPELVPAAKLVRHSHEHYDGTGYPDGLAGDQIPLGSRIILAADAFHAIRSDRPYRRGRSTRAALEEMKRCAGSQFDPEVVDALLTSVRSVKRGRRQKIPVRLAVLFATLAIGSGGAFAAERGWIPSPIPGLGPESSGDAAESANEAETSSAIGGGAGESGQSTGPDKANVAGTERTDGDTRGSGEESSDGRAARRDGDRGEAGATGAGPAGETGQGDGSGSGGGTGAAQGGTGAAAPRPAIRAAWGPAAGAPWAAGRRAADRPPRPAAAASRRGKPVRRRGRAARRRGRRRAAPRAAAARHPARAARRLVSAARLPGKAGPLRASPASRRGTAATPPARAALAATPTPESRRAARAPT